MIFKRTVICSAIATLLLGVGISSISSLTGPTTPAVSARTLHRHHHKTARRHGKTRYISYRRALNYRRRIIRHAKQVIPYYHKRYRYWQRRADCNDKKLTPVYYDDTPYANHLYKLDGYYYGKATDYDNSYGDWEDILYGTERLPLRPQSARRILRSFVIYGDDDDRNGDYITYLSFCRMRHIRPRYRYKQWIGQMTYFLYEQ